MIRSFTAPRLRRPVAALTCLLFLGLPACYSYSPVGERAPDAGSEVRLRLNDRGAERVTEQTPLTDRQVVEGRIVERGSAEIRLVVSRPARRQFAAGGRSTDTVSVPQAGVESVELKQMEAGKTAALFGGIAAGSVLVGVAALNAAGSSGTPPDGGDGGTPLGISIPISVP